MEYIELNVEVEPREAGSEILVAELAEIGFESFVETEKGILAYIPVDEFDAPKIDELDIVNDPQFKLHYTFRKIEDQNWNAVWESNYDPAVIGNRCVVRAPFHEARPDLDYEIVIEPRMSFGTAHHETTSLMMELMFDLPLDGLRLLDMGCGTGVLAILAKMKNSGATVAIDNDEWAYRNTLDNVQKNNVGDISVYHGDATLLSGHEYDIVLANINRNILLNDMNEYIRTLSSNGQLLMSGFYERDLAVIRQKAESLGMKYQRHLVKNDWVAAVFSK